MAALLALAPHRSFRPVVLTNSQGKQDWIAAHGRDIRFFDYGEILPLALAERTDVCVFFGSSTGSYRLETLVANLLVAGTPLLDGSPGHRVANGSDAFIPSPPGILGLESFLHAEILPNLGQIADHVRRSRAAAGAEAEPVLRRLGGAGGSPVRASPAGDRRARPRGGSSSCRRTASDSATPSAAR